MQVLKRNGELESFDVSKIKKCIEWASVGLDINNIELESKFNSTLYEGIETNKIQNKLIDIAKSLVSISNPDWVKMAGRLSMMSLWKSVALTRNYPNYVYDPDKYSYLEYYSQQLNSNNYSDDLNLFDYYSVNELEEVTDWIDYSRDLDYDYAGVVSWIKAYLVEHELPQEAIVTIALMIAAKEPDKLKLAKEIYDAISLRKISLATPFLANLRKSNGSLSSCFIISMEDDSQSILDAVREAALISKNGGGVGIYLSNLRCSGSLMKGKYSKGVGGVIPYAQLFNATALAWNQGGVRKGAFTLALDVWHYDVLDFLDLRLENKDNRLTAHDIFPQLCVNNLFLTRLENKEQWTLLDPHEVYLKTGKELGKLWGKEFEEVYLQAEQMFLQGKLKIGKTVEAKEILKRVFKSWEQSGLPYIFFKDTVNELNPNYKTGLIPCSNLCVESYSNVSSQLTHVCNLISLNLANCLTNEEIAYYTRLSVKALDIAIDLTVEPTAKALAHNNFYRVIGLGSMGLHDYLAYKQLQYGTPKALQETKKVFELIALNAARESVDLAYKGLPDGFNESTWNEGKIYSRSLEWYKDNAFYYEDWVQLQKEINVKGIRNTQLLAIAPNTSSALIQGCTPSVFPARDKIYAHSKGTGTMDVVVPHIKEGFWYYRPAKAYTPEQIIEVIQEIQKWTDTGISMELLVDLNDEEQRTAKYLYDRIMQAWKGGSKAIYYVRFLTKSENVLSEVGCATCIN